MHAHDGMDHRVSPRQFDRAPAAFDRRADRQDAFDPCGACAIQHGVEVGREILVIEVRMRVDEYHENRLEMILMLNPRMARLKTNETIPCKSASRRICCELIETSETWLVIPMTNEK